jgi:hypothetical protein
MAKDPACNMNRDEKTAKHIIENNGIILVKSII